MKIIIVGMLAAVLFQQRCGQEKTVPGCYKGRLEIKGICGNSTISVVEGHMDPSKIEASWTDEQSRKTYHNAFALGSPCSFPASIEEGQTFYFTLDAPPQNCAVCRAYRAKPAKTLAIRVLDKPCR